MRARFAGFIVAAALAGSAGPAYADDVQLASGGAFHYGNLGVVSIGSGPNAVDLGGVWNYHGLVRGTKAFAIDSRWVAELLVDNDDDGLSVIDWFPEPGGGPTPKPQLPATSGSILDVPNLASVSNGTLVRDRATGVRFNDALTADGQNLLGGFVFNPSTGGALDGDVIAAVSDESEAFQLFHTGIGASTLFEQQQPAQHPHADRALGLTRRAIKDERRILKLINGHLLHAAAGRIASAERELADAASEMRLAREAGEVDSNHDVGLFHVQQAGRFDRLAAEHFAHAAAFVKEGLKDKQDAIHAISSELQKAATLSR